MFCNSNTNTKYILFLLILSLLLLFVEYNIYNVSGQATAGGHVPGITNTAGTHANSTDAGGNVPGITNTAGTHSKGYPSAGTPAKRTGATGHVPGITNTDGPFLHKRQVQRFHCGGVFKPCGPCISIYLPSSLGGGIDNCLRLYERTHIFNFINPTVMLKPFSGGWCSIGDYKVRDINGQAYCLESDK